MSRVLFISLQVGESSSKGHIHPLIASAQQLVAEGHAVGWLSLPRALGAEDAEQVRGTGAQILPVSADAPGLLSDEELSRLALRPEDAWRAYASFLISSVPAMVPSARRAISAFAPEVIAADSMSYAGAIAAHQLGVPRVAVCAGLKMLHGGGFAGAYRPDLEPLRPLRQALFAGHGMRPRFRLLECLSEVANAVFATGSLVGSLRPPARTFLLGPAIPRGLRGDERPFPWDRLVPGRPLVYAAFGSVHTREQLLDLIEPLAAAVAALGAQLVVASEALARTRPPLPGAVVLVPYAPQLELLQRADAFVTHGGANSVMEAIWAGVPLLVVPLSGDQPLQGRLVQEAGIGLRLERERLSRASVLQAVGALLDPGSRLRVRMALARDDYRANDGGAGLCRLLLRVARRGADARAAVG